MTEMAIKVKLDTTIIDEIVRRYPNVSYNEGARLIIVKALGEKFDENVWPQPLDTWNSNYPDRIFSDTPEGWRAKIVKAKTTGKWFGTWEIADEDHQHKPYPYITDRGMDYTHQEIWELFRRDYARRRRNFKVV